MEKNQAKTTCLSRFTDSKQRRCGRLLQRLATFLVLFLCSMTMSWAQGTATGSNGKKILKDAKSPAITLNSNETNISKLSFTITVIDDNEEQPGTSLVTFYTTDGSDPEDSSNGKRTKLDGKSEVTVTVDWKKDDKVKVRAFTMRIDDSDDTNYDGSKEATQEFHNTGDTDLPCVDDPVITPGDQAVVKGSLDVFNVTISHDQWTEATKDKLHIYYIIKYERNEDGTITQEKPTETEATSLPLTLTLTKSGTVKAYAKFTGNGENVKYDEVSRTYILLDDATTYLNEDDTKPVGTIVDKKVDEKGTTMTMTYGGIADGTNNFTKFTNVDYSEDNILGSLHAVTNTTLYLNKDAMSEKKDIEYYSHKKASRQKLHERTFGLPARGSFYKFEPEANGVLTVFVEQQGAMPKSQGELYTSYVRKRPVYFLDEAGNSIQATYAYTSSKINKADWEKIQGTSFDESSSDAEIIKKLNEYYKGIIDGTNNTFTNINSAVAGKRAKLELGTSIQPIIVLNQKCNKDILEDDANYDDTGYMMISEGYVTYRFPVKAGKTYYLFASGTKLALSGFTFKKDKNYKTEDLQKVTLDGNADNTTTIDGLTEGNQYNVTLKNRSFGNGKWYALVLPFSVSQKQMKSVFGKEVKVLHYNNVKGSTLNLFEHYYQMIVGGTPVLVKPSQNVTDPVFNNVTLTSKVVVEMEYTGFKCTGSWDNVDFPKYSYFIDANKSKFYQYDPTKVTGDKKPHAGAFRTWIISTSNNPSAAKQLTMRINGIEDNNETTAIWNAVIGNDDNAEVASKGIYNLSGQKMNVTDTRSLSKGIYIVNGKKYIVK